jgi:pimeloyl-ACP methyl ester carboxylesterase
MATIVLAHGAWSAAWAWRKMRPLFAAAGHQFFSPTYTGLGERAHLSHHEIDLTTHINDVAAVLDCEDLKDVTLLGHSYGGMVATGVADKARRRIARVVYIDAFAPQDGQSLFDLVGQQAAENMRGKAMGEGAGWRIAPNPMPPDTAPEDVTWATPRRRSQPCGSHRANRRCRAPTSMPSAAGRATRSASSPSAPKAIRAGSITRWMPATIRTSPARRS